MDHAPAFDWNIIDLDCFISWMKKHITATNVIAKYDAPKRLAVTFDVAKNDITYKSVIFWEATNDIELENIQNNTWTFIIDRVLLTRSSNNIRTVKRMHEDILEKTSLENIKILLEKRFG